MVFARRECVAVSLLARIQAGLPWLHTLSLGQWPCFGNPDIQIDAPFFEYQPLSLTRDISTYDLLSNAILSVTQYQSISYAWDAWDDGD